MVGWPWARLVGKITCLACLVLVGWAWPLQLRGQDVSAPAILQIFEANWETLNDRMVDLFEVGYGRIWLPPPARGGSGFSVGYDVFDRFDLGHPSQPTHYGTAAGLRALVSAAHSATVAVNTDLILNHNGVGNRNDPDFVNLGGYPGFVLTYLGVDLDGDFHNPFVDTSQDEIVGQLVGLNDIAQEKNHSLIRHPVVAGNPQNIPAGSLFNLPDPNHARFYPDQDLGGTVVFDPQTGQNITLWDFNQNEPLAGDPTSENALGLLMRNVRWMIQEFDIDGFRLDAARHFPRWVLDSFDRATFLAKRDPLLDGSPNHVYSFSETGFDSRPFIQDFIRHDIDNNNLGQVGGNRDVLDFSLFGALKGNLTSNGLINNWHPIRNASIDLNDDGLRNGSQGVAFVQSHDETGPFLANVAYAYTLLLPGNALVYMNSEEYGTTGTFPQAGKVDALGGLYGETITRLINIRNTHGRGDFRERWLDDAFNPNGFSNVYIYERSGSVLVGLNSRNDTQIETRSGVQTDFLPGSVLVELTSVAADPSIDPGGVIPKALRVDAAGQVEIKIPGNANGGRGYVIYGLAAPQGTLSLGQVASILPGATPTVATNGTVRLESIDVITADTLEVQLTTTPVLLPAPAGEAVTVRDEYADGDNSLLRIDGGLDFNSLPGVDFTAPGTDSYGFEQYTGTRTPGYNDDGFGNNIGTGFGTYKQTIDTTQLSEGRHFITARAFRHRDDGGPAVFTDFKRTIYIDRLPPDSQIASFDPVGAEADDLDLVLRSVDQTADRVHVWLDLGAAHSDEEILSWVGSANAASQVGGGQFLQGYANVVEGNHAVTVVMIEPTGNTTIRRFVGLAPVTGRGAGFGDTDHNGFIGPADLLGFESVLWSQNSMFDATSDTNADGLVDNRDLFELADQLLASGASPPALDQYQQVLLHRGDLNEDGATDRFDVAVIYDQFGLALSDPNFWLFDLNVDGTIDVSDVTALVTQIARSVAADFDIDGDVDGADWLMLQRGWELQVEPQSVDGDANLDGQVNVADLEQWQASFGFQTEPLTAAAVNFVTTPEPSSLMLLAVCWLVKLMNLRTYSL